MSLKKWLAMVLTVVMVLAMLPSALTEETVDALEAGVTEAEFVEEDGPEIVSNALDEIVPEEDAFSLCEEDDAVPNGDFVLEGGVLTAYTGAGGNIAIPEGVVTIGDRVFCDNTAITGVTIPEGVTVIGDSAFSGCTGLRTVNLPETLAMVGDYAFYRSALSGAVAIPAGVAALGSYVFGKTNIVGVTLKGAPVLGRKVFADCDRLTSVTIPNDAGLSELGAGMFADCDGLTAVSIPDSVTEIGSGAFSGCTALSEVRLGSAVAVIGDEAFQDCGSLADISLPEALESIGSYAFSGAGIRAVNMGGNVERVGDYAFQDCANVTSLTLSRKLSSVGEYAFLRCGSADAPMAVALPESLTAIGRRAFEGFTGAGSVAVSTAAASIGERAFSDCANLQWVLIPGQSMSFGSNVFRNHRSDFVLRCAAGSDALAYAIENNIPYDTAGAERLVTVTLKSGFEPFKVYDRTADAPNLYGGDGATYRLSEAFVLSCDDGAPAEDVALTSAAAVFAGVDAGAVDVTIALEIRSTSAEYIYRLKEPTITVSGAIRPAEATVTPDAGQSKLLGADDPVFTYTVTGLLEGDALTGTLGRAPGEAAGTYDFTLNDLSNPNYALTLAPGVKFTIESTPFQSFTVAPIPDQTHTGAAIVPEVTVMNGSVPLTENVDYSVVYENNIRVGEATATFTGMGSYRGASQTLTFNIRDHSEKSFTVSPIAEQLYTGAAVTPALIVLDGTTVLRRTQDYVAQYSNNVNEGTASVVVLGAGDYAGVKRVATFTIVKKVSLNDPTVTVSPIPAQSYTGLPVTPSFTVTCEGTLLLEGVDYTASYSDNVEPGQASITLIGMGDYYGTRVVSFTIGEREFLLSRKSSLTVYVDEDFTIVVPLDNAVSFKSSKSSVATVDEDGLVTPLKEGKTKITVTLETKKKLTLKLTVKDPYKPTSIDIEGDSTRYIDLYEYMQDEEPLELTCLIFPLTAADAEITWKSSNKKVATVDEDGLVTPISEGKTTITATAGKKSDSIKVRVTNNYAPSRIWFEEGKSAEVTVEDSMDLTLVGLNKTGGEEFYSTYKWDWKSSYLDVEVGDDGMSASVTFLKKGKAKITVKSANGKKATFTFKITEEKDDDDDD